MDKLSDFIVTNTKQILHHLNRLAENKTIVCAVIDNEKSSYLTTIIKLDLKNQVLILGLAPTEALNYQMLNASMVQFRGELEGIKVIFNTQSISKLETHKESHFIIPIPKAIFWMQRRQIYRVKIPVSHNNSFLEINFSENIDLEIESFKKNFILSDLSITGFSFLNSDKNLLNHFYTHQELTEAQLVLHDGNQAKISFEIKSIKKLSSRIGAQQRIGVKFTAIPYIFESHIHRYMQEIGRQQLNVLSAAQNTI